MQPNDDPQSPSGKKSATYTGPLGLEHSPASGSRRLILRLSIVVLLTAALIAAVLFLRSVDNPPIQETSSQDTISAEEAISDTDAQLASSAADSENTEQNPGGGVDRGIDDKPPDAVNQNPPPDNNSEPGNDNGTEDDLDLTFRLLIPKLGVDALVYDELRPKSDDETFGAFEDRIQEALLQGVLHYPTSYLPGQNGDGFNSNIVIMGHSSGILLFNDSPREQKYKFIFKQLNQLAEGDIVQIHYKKNQYTYRIYKKKVVKPSAVEVLRSDSENTDLKHNGTLTLITCEPPGTIDFRLVLLAEQITPAASGNSEVQIQDDTGGEDFVPGEPPTSFFD